VLSGGLENSLWDGFKGGLGNSLRDVFSGSLGNSLRDMMSGGLEKSFEDIPVSSKRTAVYIGHKLRDLQTWTNLWYTSNERYATGFRIRLKVIIFRKENSSVLGCDAKPMSKRIPTFRLVLSSLSKSNSTKSVGFSRVARP
jgi:hypothetical protein